MNRFRRQIKHVFHKPWWLLVGLILASVTWADHLVENDFPSDWWYQENEPAKKNSWGSIVQIFSGLVGAGGYLLWASGRSGLQSVREEDAGRKQGKKKLDQLSKFFFAKLLKETGCEFDEITARFFCVDRRKRESVLKPVSEVSFVGRQSSGITWTKGKGVVGKVWENKEKNYLNTETEDFSQATSSEENWRNASDGLKAGLSWQEVRRVAGKYSVVIAFPILAGPNVIGVLAVDGPKGTFLKLNASGVEDLAGEVIKLSEEIVFDIWQSYK